MTDSSLLASKWFTRGYQLREGWICPKEGAPLREYDPFEIYDAYAGSRCDGQPHLEFAALHDADDDMIVDWVNKYGLLGFLHHDLVQVTYYSKSPEWIPFEIPDGWQRGKALCYMETPNEHGRLFPTALMSTVEGIIDDALLDDGLAEFDTQGEIVFCGYAAESDTREQYRPLAKTTLTNLLDGEAQTHCRALVRNGELPGLSVCAYPEYLVDYAHPDHSVDGYPSLHAEHFWDVYCEPIEKIRMAAQLLHGRMLFLSDEPLPTTPDITAPWQYKELGVNIMQSQLTRVAPKPLFDADFKRREYKVGWGWRFPSLLSALYMMTYRTSISGKPLVVCEYEPCTNLVVQTRSGVKRTKYCSDRHYENGKKRELRKNDPDYDRRNRGRPKRTL